MPELAQDLVIAGRFRLIRKLGQGGMGSVWLATHLTLDIPCAIKFIEGDYAHVPEMQARFEREAKAAAALRSPHVVQIIDHAIWEGMPFIAMELLDGEDLGKRLQKVGRLPPNETVHVIAQVCRALTKAHQQNIVHRDLKPDNIYLVRDDDREIAKVLDFGIAKSSSGMESGSNTKTGAMLGTPYYMSPEQAQGTKAVDFRSDLWSMAVIAFQSITGRLPFESEALGDLLMKIMVAPLPVPSQFAPVPAGFDAWWMRAASRDPSGRFNSAKEFVDSLSMALGVTAGQDLSGSSGGRMVMSPPSGATLPLGAITGNPANTPYPGATPNPVAHTFAEMPAAKKSPIGLIIGGAVVVLVLVVGGAVFALKKGHNDAPINAAQDHPMATPPAATQVVAPPPVVSVAAAIDPIPPAASASALQPIRPNVKTPVIAGKPAAGTPKPTVTAAVATPPPANTTKQKTDLGF